MGSISLQHNPLISLATDILHHTNELSSLLAQNGIPLQTWDEDALDDYTETGPEGAQIQKARYALLDTLTSLQRLVLGPSEHIRALVSNAPIDSGTMRAIVKLKLPQFVPFGSSISFKDLATETNVNQDILTRIIRYSITNGIFREQPPGHVCHTAASAALARGDIGVAMSWSAEVPLLSAVRLVEAIPTTGQDSRTAAFNIAYGTEDTMWEYQKKHPELDKIFGENMATELGDSRLSPMHAVSGFNWAKLEGGMVVDVGGSTGHISMAIVEKFPKIRFLVQDLYHDRLPSSKKALNQICFQHHDFFTPQTISPPDAFFIRYIFHNWSDEAVVRIVQALKPALRKGARLLVNEYLGPVGRKDEVGHFEERTYRLRDMQMLALLDAKERSLDDYIELVSRADERFKFVGSITPPGSSMSVIEWVYA
ncbi:S-adenosyl-L-methionine-dependent methyltransferase [Aspergillus karnatakaensis]|uniref:S-adenosyl-L-methionine-dependent methyltransferase n=1 Tax=Aspergillus karnatakaensis TaxID=1810916 RepID=UPI003CCCA4DF